MRAERHLRASAWLGAEVALLGMLPLSAQHTLDPALHRSPSGKVSLYVDPGQRSGAGPARYRCQQADRELWSGTRPWTLWDAEVTDEGVVAGYAYGAGVCGGDDDALTLVIIGPDGKARLEEQHSRSGKVGCLSSPDVFVTGLMLDEEGDRFVVRIRGDAPWTPEESWYTYALSSGLPGPVLAPVRALPSDRRSSWIRTAQMVPESGLTLAHWEFSDHRQREHIDLFTLHARDGSLVWSLEWPRDYAGPVRATSELWRAGAILLTTRDTFTLWHLASDEHVRFGLERRDDGGTRWSVREVERTPRGASGAPQVVPSVPRLELEHLGTIRLETASDSSGDPAPLGRIVLGPGDRIHALEPSTGAVQVFWPDGRLERVCRSEPGDFERELRLLSSLAVTDAGEVLLMNLRFSAGGRRIGPAPLGCTWIGSSLHAQHGTELLWAIRGDRVERIRLDGEVLVRIERTPAGQWLRGITAAAVAPDGSLALVTEYPFGDASGCPGIHLYSARGEPVRSLPPPPWMSPGWTFAHDGTHIVIAASFPGEPGSVLVLEENGRVLGRLVPSGGPARWSPILAAHGAELWLYDGQRRLERYRMP